MHGGAKSSVTLTRGEPISQSGRCLSKMSDDRTPGIILLSLFCGSVWKSSDIYCDS